MHQPVCRWWTRGFFLPGSIAESLEEVFPKEDPPFPGDPVRYSGKIPANQPRKNPSSITRTETDVSSAHVWLPEQFPVCSHLAVFMRIGELNFRGQAEVVEAASHPKGGNYRHSLRWISLSPQAKAALSKVIDAAA